MSGISPAAGEWSLARASALATITRGGVKLAEKF